MKKLERIDEVNEGMNLRKQSAEKENRELKKMA
jgi:hypothetical protein